MTSLDQEFVEREVQIFTTFSTQFDGAVKNLAKMAADQTTKCVEGNNLFFPEANLKLNIKLELASLDNFIFKVPEPLQEGVPDDWKVFFSTGPSHGGRWRQLQSRPQQCRHCHR